MDASKLDAYKNMTHRKFNTAGSDCSYTFLQIPAVTDSEGCSLMGTSEINYILVFEDSAGMVLEQRVLTSENCRMSDDFCFISLGEISAVACLVTVLASNPFGNSTSSYVNMGIIIILVIRN